MLRKFFNGSSEASIFLKSILWCNLVLITSIFWIWGVVKVVKIIDKWLDNLYIEMKNSYNTEDMVAKINKEIAEALDNEEYEKAAILKKRLDKLKK
jgi:hypothetical protein